MCHAACASQRHTARLCARELYEYRGIKKSGIEAAQFILGTQLFVPPLGSTFIFDYPFLNKMYTHYGTYNLTLELVKAYIFRVKSYVCVRRCGRWCPPQLRQCPSQLRRQVDCLRSQGEHITRISHSVPISLYYTSWGHYYYIHCIMVWLYLNIMQHELLSIYFRKYKISI